MNEEDPSQAKPANDPLSARKLLAFKVMAVFMGILVGIGLLEVVLQLSEIREKPTTNTEPRLFGADEARATGTAAIANAYQPSPWYTVFEGRPLSVPHELVPFSQISEASGTKGPPFGYQNSHGFRTPEYTIARPPRTFRVLIVGDSFTWGDGLPLEDTYHHKLQEMIDLAITDHSVPIEIIALGQNGNTFFDNLSRLFVYGQTLKPDLVMIQFFENDLELTPIQSIRWRSSPASSGLGATQIGNLLKGNVLTKAIAAERRRVFTRGSPEWRLFENGLAQLKQWSDKNQVPISLLGFPSVSVDPNRQYRKDRWSRPSSFRYLDQAILRAREEGIESYSLKDAFAQSAGEYFAASSNNAHYNALASEIVATFLFDSIFSPLIENLRGASWRSGSETYLQEKQLRDNASINWTAYHTSLTAQIELFEQLYSIDENNPNTLQSLVRIYREAGLFDAATATSLRLQELLPNHVAPWYDLALTAESPEEKNRLFGKMNSHFSGHSSSLQSLGRRYGAAGMREKACACLAELLTKARHEPQYRWAENAIAQNECPEPVQPTCLSTQD